MRPHNSGRRADGEDAPSLRAYDEDGDRVIIAQTFSKSFSPGIRSIQTGRRRIIS